MTPRWYALYTRSRHEKFIDVELKKRCIESFLPLRTIKRRWSDRTVTVDEPLFKSYLFVKTDPVKAVDVLKTKGAVRFVTVQSKPVPIAEAVISSLKNILEREIAVDPFPYLESGMRVSVRSGIFKGVEGFVVRKDNKKCRVVISIDALQASISIEVDACLIEKV
ncbi:MAG: hypothetical protein AUJ72_01105 [Candidatus Omnitrophica bacterium CG1_02_46_14]|nr:MAG: hypothetical protein AUJ72_01105 [Candidatus Omnitrophica bacterium CG1_02_46_14]